MEQKHSADLFRAVPSVDKLLRAQETDPLHKLYSHELLKTMIHRALNELREDIRSGAATVESCSIPSVIARIEQVADKCLGSKLRNVINATGVIVHTNLGRSVLSKRVTDRIAGIASTYSNLEYSLEQGKRGERNAHLRSLMKELTGAESTLAVNNNAAAVFLALSSLAYGKEVIVSRGELIEIGGSFRIPDVMARSGAILREVGTTNRTHPKDYRAAINENTALILKVHTSNYRIVGFTREVELDELAEIGREYGIPTMMDLGSGCLVDLSAFGLAEEITVQQVLQKGIDVVSFSGDKLLGGPQAGILAGKFESIEKMRTNPMARALRMDKLTLAGLEATLQEYASADGPFKSIPTLKMISLSFEELSGAAEKLLSSLARELGEKAELQIEQGVGRVGGGALPMSDLPGPRVTCRMKNISSSKLEHALRTIDPPIIALVHEDAILFDPRTLQQGDIERIPGLMMQAISTLSS